MVRDAGGGGGHVKIKGWLSAVAVHLRDLPEPPLGANPLPTVPPDKARGVVVSFYMPNISRTVVAAQRRLLKRFTPPDVAIEQVRTTRKHEHAINHFMDTTAYRAVLILDIDCVPIRSGAIEDVFARIERGHLVGAVQRADHIRNNDHLYAGPFCVALSQQTYTALGRPKFDSTPRGDVGEELTYAAERLGVPVDLLWPTHSDDHIWRLADGKTFGHGTTYEDSFWHAFQIRFRSHQRRFVQRCDAFLAGSPAAPGAPHPSG
jgi:hypothetical protein